MGVSSQRRVREHPIQDLDGLHTEQGSTSASFAAASKGLAPILDFALPTISGTSQVPDTAYTAGFAPPNSFDMSSEAPDRR